MILFKKPFLLICLAWMTGCGNKSVETDQKSASDSSSGNPLTAPVDYLGAVGQAQKSAAANTSLASLKQAIAHYQTGEGRFPETLNQLVEEGYIARLPDLPTGKSYRYDPKSGQIGLQ